MSQPSLFASESSARSATANIDGGSRGNRGPAGFGVRIELVDGTIVEIKRSIGIGTNDIAEYHGPRAALKWATEHGVAMLHVRSDSELLVKQMRGGVSREERRPSAAPQGGTRTRASDRQGHVRARPPRAQQRGGPAGE